MNLKTVQLQLEKRLPCVSKLNARKTCFLAALNALFDLSSMFMVVKTITYETMARLMADKTNMKLITRSRDLRN